MRNKKGQFVVGSKHLVTHGLAQTRPYNTWNHMMFRCYHPTDSRWPQYGGRGIKVCEKWHDFIGFWEDMKEGYSKELTLDRINNEGDYSKENCRWTTQKEQCRNKRTTLKIDYRGKKRVLIELCSELGLKYHMVYLRLFRYHWPIERALN
jgi:hypothetical protein